MFHVLNCGMMFEAVSVERRVRVIYLDNSATTPVHADVVRIMSEVMQDLYGNPSSLHGMGVKAERLVEQARKVVAEALDATPQEILFTSGGTEANNMAIRGIAKKYRNRGNHIITTEVEHASVYEVFRYLEQEGYQVTYLPVDEAGRIRLTDLECALTEDTILVSIMHVNNEVGTIQPIEEIGQLLQKYPKVYFHVDAVQAFSKIPISVRKAHIDALSLSAHKFHGPKGVGALYIRKNVSIEPLILGGGQERGLRSGTQNVPGIAGLAKATLLARQNYSKLMPEFQNWKENFIAKAQEEFHGMMVNGDISLSGGAPYIISLSFSGLKSEVLVHALEGEKVFVSSKSACSSKAEVPSRVLKAMGLTDEAAIGSIRISMGAHTAAEDLQKCLHALQRVVPKLQQVMKVRKR